MSLSSSLFSVIVRQSELQGDTSSGEPRLDWLWFGMSHHLAQLLSQFCQFLISPGRTRQRVEEPKSNSTQPLDLGLPVLYVLCGWAYWMKTKHSLETSGTKVPKHEDDQRRRESWSSDGMRLNLGRPMSVSAAVWLEWWWIVLVRHFVCRKVHFLGTADMFPHRVNFFKKVFLTYPK